MSLFQLPRIDNPCRNTNGFKLLSLVANSISNGMGNAVVTAINKQHIDKIVGVFALIISM